MKKPTALGIAHPQGFHPSSPPRPLPEGCLYCGPTEASHFAKMIHNGIEYRRQEIGGNEVKTA